MTPVSLTQVLSAPSFDPVRLAAAAYLARFKGQSRVHTESDLRAYLHWCAEHGLDPLAATRPHIELHVRWMQEQRRYAASTARHPDRRQTRRPSHHDAPPVRARVSLDRSQLHPGRLHVVRHMIVNRNCRVVGYVGDLWTTAP